MKFTLVVIFLLFAAAASNDIGTSGLQESLIAWLEKSGLESNRGLSLKDIVEKFIKEFEGRKEMTFSRVEIDERNRLENVTVVTDMRPFVLDMKEALREIDIKNLTMHANEIRINGWYDFQELHLPGGLKLYGKGDIKIELENLELFLLLAGEYKSGAGKWNITNIGASASLGKITIDLENFMYGEPMGDFLLTMARELIKVGVDLLKGFVEENKEPIMELVGKMLNQILGNE